MKSDNFMLTIGAVEAKAGSTEENVLASRIRLIDLAIATQWTTLYSETDEADFNGTPLYASLNVHSGKKASFRDDLEALGYVLAELLIQLNSGDPSKQLPWSHGKSDDDIWSIKKAFVEDENSEFYAQLGNDKTRRPLLEYMNTVRGYSFKKVPDYDNLSKILSKITLPRRKMGMEASTTPHAASRGTTRSRRTATAKKMMPSKYPRTNTLSLSKSARRSTTKSTNIEHDEDQNMMSDGESIYVDASEEMDWEDIVDENEKPKGDFKPSDRSDRSLRRQRAGKVEEIEIDDEESELSESHSSTGLKRRGVRIFVTEGPHKGEYIDLEADVSETVIIGSNPASKVGKVFPLEKDNTLHKTHVRLDLDRKNRKLTAIKVTDKSKNNGKTYVNRNVVKNTKAFINDRIIIGNTTLKVQTL